MSLSAVHSVNVAHLQANKMSRSPIKILLAAEGLYYSFQILSLRGAITQEVHMQSSPLIYITCLLFVIKKRKSNSSPDLTTNNIDQ